MIKWMTDSAILFRRHPDPEEEPDLVNLEIVATNGEFASRVQFYCGVRDVETFGVALSKFPGGAADKPTFLRGEEQAQAAILA